MDNFQEIIGPLIVGALYILGNLFNKMKKANEAEDESPEQRQISQQQQLQERQQAHEEAEHWRRVRARQSSQAAPIESPQKIPAVPNHTSQRQNAEIVDDRSFSWDNSDQSYESTLELQLKQIEATKREAARLQSVSPRHGIDSSGEIGSLRKRSKKAVSRSIRSSFKHSGAARSAFIYGEVLGPPVSLRKTSGVPGLTS